MSDHRWQEQCELCGRSIDVGLWTRDRDRQFCTLCQIELDDLPMESIGDKLPKADSWPEVTWPIGEETEYERQTRWTEDDHRWTMDHPYWGRNPIDRDT